MCPSAIYEGDAGGHFLGIGWASRRGIVRNDDGGYVRAEDRPAYADK